MCSKKLCSVSTFCVDRLWWLIFAVLSILMITLSLSGCQKRNLKTGMHFDDTFFKSAYNVNVNYLIDNNRKRQLDAVLHSYNLAGVVKFPTRTGLNSYTANDNVFFDASTTGKYDLYPLINGLSDYDA